MASQSRSPLASGRLRLLLWGLIVANVVLVWVLPVLPQQDLPQHLAYATILRDHAVPGLPFGEMYAPIDEFQMYFSSYYLLRWLSFGASIEVGIRVLMSLYVVGLLSAFAFLVRVATPPEQGPSWTVLLAVPFVWNPPVVMGFLAYYCGLPLLLAAVAATLGWLDERAGPMRWMAIIGSIGCALLHPFLGATLFACLLGCAVFHPARKRARLALVPALAALAVVGTGFVIGNSGLGEASSLDLADAWRRGFGVEFISIVLGFEWSGTTAKINYSLWSVLGPFTLPTLGIVALVVVAVAVPAARVIRAHRQQPLLTPGGRTLLRVAGTMLLLGWLVPFGMHKPTELTFIDLRLLSVGWMLTACCIPAVTFSDRFVRRATVVACAAFFVHLAYRLDRAASEASALFGLLDSVEPGRVLMSLMLNNDSPHLAKQFRVSHFLPMYYTVRQHGIATQFWARYTHHLPVDYAPGKRPRHTEDWKPEAFVVADLSASDYVVVRDPSRRRDPAYRVKAARRIHERLKGVVEEIGRDGLWVLYRVDADAVGTRGSKP
ncbi:MAG: hypothetical protein K0V04_39805 [Deltaproteobacteria bacterium]|nr:hypothetical protein [Deltaproteobacteria bacterium]